MKKADLFLILLVFIRPGCHCEGVPTGTTAAIYNIVFPAKALSFPQRLCHSREGFVIPAKAGIQKYPAACWSYIQSAKNHVLSPFDHAQDKLHRSIKTKHLKLKTVYSV